ncbi:hypothetical protein D9M72_295320 [compost metagenome]
MRCCIALKARAACATSVGPSSASVRPFRSGPSWSAAADSCASGRVTSRTATQAHTASTSSWPASSHITQPDTGMPTRMACTTTDEPSPSRTSICRPSGGQATSPTLTTGNGRIASTMAAANCCEASERGAPPCALPPSTKR